MNRIIKMKRNNENIERIIAYFVDNWDYQYFGVPRMIDILKESGYTPNQIVKILYIVFNWREHR